MFSALCVKFLEFLQRSLHCNQKIKYKKKKQKNVI